MIKSSEIRIGNIIKVHVAGNFKVIDIGKHSVSFEGLELKGLYDYSILYGVPLTPELLVDNCGFHVTSKGFYQHPDWYNISLKYARGTYQIRCNFMDIIANNIDYVHQLQNLYHDLCHKELEIKNLLPTQ